MHQSVGEPVVSAVVVYLLGDILDDLNLGELQDQGQFIEVCIVLLLHISTTTHICCFLKMFLNVSNALTTRSVTIMEAVSIRISLSLPPKTCLLSADMIVT